MSFLDGILKAGHFEDVWNDPTAWQPAYFFGPGDRMPVTGKTLTAEDILYCSVVWRCVNLIADTVAKLPRYLYKMTPDGHSELALSHPLFRLASRAPNPEMTKFEFDQLAVFNACMWGNHYALIKRDDRGVARTLWMLDPARMTVRRLNNGELRFDYALLKGKPEEYKQKDISRFYRHSYNGVTGVPISAAAADAIALCRAFIEYSGKFFQNDATPPWVIMHDNTLTPAAKKTIRESIEGQTKGLGKRFKFAILDAGLKAQALGINSNRDAQLTEQQRGVIAEIARYFGVPLHKLAELTRSTNNNISQQALEFYTDCIDAWITMMGEAYTRDLVPWEQQGVYYIEYDPKELLFADPVAKHDNARKNVMSCIWTPNEGRREIGSPPDPSPRADMLLFPTSHAPGAEVISAPEPDPQDEPDGDEEESSDQEDDKDANEKE